MPRKITIDEAEQDLDEVLAWAAAHNEGVMLEQAGKVKGVVMAIDDYAELTRLQEAAVTQKKLDLLEMIRREGADLNQDLTDEEKYRLAGFSEEVIRELLEADTQLAQRK